MTDLELPKFEMPEVPHRRVPREVWMEIHTEFVRRPKQSGAYEQMQRSPAHEPASVRFKLRD